MSRMQETRINHKKRLSVNDEDELSSGKFSDWNMIFEERWKKENSKKGGYLTQLAQLAQLAHILWEKKLSKIHWRTWPKIKLWQNGHAQTQ